MKHKCLDAALPALHLHIFIRKHAVLRLGESVVDALHVPSTDYRHMMRMPIPESVARFAFERTFWRGQIKP